jgi:uncharacterized membrane protein YbhN (UPF0104 family)
MRTHRSTLIASGTALAALAVLAAVPTLLGHRVLPSLSALTGGNPDWLTLAVAGFAAAFLFTVGAWRAAFAAAGARICPREAAARLGIGSLVNAVAPAKLGDAVKVALLSRALDGPSPLWTGGGVYAALAAARSLALASLVVVASATGALPLWPVFALFGLFAAVVAAARFSQRLRTHRRLSQLLEGIGSFARSPRTALTVIAWSLAEQLARVLAAMAVAQGFGVPHPALAALLIAAALELAGAFPITPGSFGIGSGAVAVALASRGIGMTQALAVGLAIQTLQTAVSLTAGAAGALYLARLNEIVRRWTLRVALVGASTSAAALLSFVLLNFD